MREQPPRLSKVFLPPDSGIPRLFCKHFSCHLSLVASYVESSSEFHSSFTCHQFATDVQFIAYLSAAYPILISTIWTWAYIYNFHIPWAALISQVVPVLPPVCRNGATSAGSAAIFHATWSQSAARGWDAPVSVRCRGNQYKKGNTVMESLISLMTQIFTSFTVCT